MTDTMDVKTAELEFENLADGWDLDTDTASMDEDDHKGFDEAKRRLLRGMTKGFVTVSEDGETVKLTLKKEVHGTTELTFEMPNGAAYISTDKHKDRKTMHKVQSFMAAMTGKPEAFFSAMGGPDYKRAQSLVMLFLGS